MSVGRSKVAGVSQKMSSGILPPELIFQIDLSRNEDPVQRLVDYWQQVSSDALDFKVLTPDDVHNISSALQCFHAEQHAMKMSKGIFGALTDKSENTSMDDTSELSWRDRLSDALDDISIVDLPDSLAHCETIAEFDEVWNRIKLSVNIWGKVRPRISENERYAYCVKYYNDLSDGDVDHDKLPYNLVTSSRKIDIWAFGVLVFSMCSQSSLFHVTADEQLHGTSAFKELYEWNMEAAKRKIADSISDPVAQDLLLKILVPEDERLSSMEAVLKHPFFGPSSSTEAQNILEAHEERQLQYFESKRMKNMKTRNHRNGQPLSMEKYCKIIFDRLEDILFPTSLIVMPFSLQFNKQRQELEIPNVQEFISLGEDIADHLIKINTTIAKLSFWLRVKENLSQKDGSEFKAKIISWIQRARNEGSQSIAREIVSAVKCDERYIGICMEMLDEEMSISHARAFIRDPMKAAAMLLENTIRKLTARYSRHYLYLVDEFHGAPSVVVNTDEITKDEYKPTYIQPDTEDFEQTLLPFMIITMFVVTATDGLDGLSRLIGFPTSHKLPKSWINSNVGVLPLHTPNKPAQSIVVQFATLYSILRQRQKEMTLFQTRSYSSIPSSDNYNLNMDGNELLRLQAFYHSNDPRNHFAGLFRTFDENDSSLNFWTSVSAFDYQAKNHEEFNQALRRLELLQKEIEGKKKLEEEVKLLNDKIGELKKETEARLLRRSQRAEASKRAVSITSTTNATTQGGTQNLGTLSMSRSGSTDDEKKENRRGASALFMSTSTNHYDSDENDELLTRWDITTQMTKMKTSSAPTPKMPFSSPNYNPPPPAQDRQKSADGIYYA